MNMTLLTAQTQASRDFIGIIMPPMIPLPNLCIRLIDGSGTINFQGPCTAAQLGQWTTVGYDKKRSEDGVEYIDTNDFQLRAAVGVGNNNGIDGVTWTGAPGLWLKISGGCTQTIICNANGSFSDGGCCCNLAAAVYCQCTKPTGWPCGQCTWQNPAAGNPWSGLPPNKN